MVKNQSQIKRIVSRYRKELIQSGIRVTATYIFGSYAHGLAHEGSDIDLIIVSPDFNEMNLRERLELLGLAAIRILEPIQAFGLTPEEVEKRKLNPFWLNILENEAVLV